jgi:hypothetical protein
MEKYEHKTHIWYSCVVLFLLQNTDLYQQVGSDCSL